MHELAVCQALLEQVSHVARERDAVAVNVVGVRLGPLSGVEPHLLERAFEIARAGGVAANAQLVVEPEPVRIQCRGCGGEHDTDASHLRCPACGHGPVRLVSGDALILERLEIERRAPVTGGVASHV